MAKEIVCKGFYAARPQAAKTGRVEYKRISRTFHARDAAVEFCTLANIGVPDDMKARVMDEVGVEPLAKGAGR